MRRVLSLPVLLLLLASACMPPSSTPVAEASSPQTELLAPPSGTRLLLGEELEVESRSTDGRGLSRVELWVDGGIYRVDEAKGQRGRTGPQ